MIRLNRLHLMLRGMKGTRLPFGKRGWSNAWWFRKHGFLQQRFIAEPNGRLYPDGVALSEKGREAATNAVWEYTVRHNRSIKRSYWGPT